MQHTIRSAEELKMHYLSKGRCCAAALLAFLVCCCTPNPILAQFDGLMVDGTTIRRFNIGTGAILSTRTITGQQALFGMLTMDSGLQSLYLIDGFNDGSSDRT